jgi:hypothetical protein
MDSHNFKSHQNRLPENPEFEWNFFTNYRTNHTIVHRHTWHRRCTVNFLFGTVTTLCAMEK